MFYQGPSENSFQISDRKAKSKTSNEGIGGKTAGMAATPTQNKRRKNSKANIRNVS